MAIWKGAHPSNYHAGRRGHQPEAIVIHIMDGSLIGTDAWFANPVSRVSAHYGIGRTGAVHQYVDENDCAFHAGTVVNPQWAQIKRDGGRCLNPNLYTIGIEHEGRGLSTDNWPTAMREASLDLVAGIARRWNIPIDDQHIIPHKAIRSSKPHCPGKGINLARYIADLAKVPAPAPVSERPFARTIRVVRTVKVRRQPNTHCAAPRRLLPGDSFAAVALAEGEPVSGNASWFRTADWDYIWSGNTDHPAPA